MDEYESSTSTELYQRCRLAYKKLTDDLSLEEFLNIILLLRGGLLILDKYERTQEYDIAQITDCANTADAILNLFEPKNKKIIQMYDNTNLGDINGNIVSVAGNIMGEFHKFIGIRGPTSDYILTAYTGKYCLRVIKIPNLIDFLAKITNEKIPQVSDYTMMFF